MLAHGEVHRKLMEDPTRSVSVGLDNLLTEGVALGILDTKEYLFAEFPKCPIFNALP